MSTIAKDQKEEWEDPYPKKRRHWMGMFTVPFLFLALYVLSTGPATVLNRKGMLDLSSMETIYMPLIALTDAAPPLHRFMSWYVNLWAP